LLPVEKIIPELRSTFFEHRNVVLSASPGAGKTTRVPIALLNEPWLAGKKIIMLEPRRLAARRSATFMAEQLGEQVGGTVGYRIRGENKIADFTKVEVVTEGILTRMLQDDPALPQVGIVIFDEFHERSIHADLGLALTLDVQNHLRQDLRLLIMSATLDGIAISSLIGDAPVVVSEGKSFPVETKYLSQEHRGKIEQLVFSTTIRSLRNDTGDILAFLPGQREIRNVELLLLQSELPPNVDIHLLYGEAPAEKQRDALLPALQRRRKIILSTSVAETSLTINGVRVVIDSGLSRTAKFDPRRGMSGLVTGPVSQASAEQRRGRAGREYPGVCYRLWTELQHSQLNKFSPPEIVNADLAPFALELALWGEPEGNTLKFLDSPPPSHFTQARTLLNHLGITDNNGKLTQHGAAVARFGIHPRLAHMLIKGKELGLGALACEAAALLDERDLFRSKKEFDIEFSARWKSLKSKKEIEPFAKERILQQSHRLKNLINVSDTSTSSEKLGILLALAYPERVAKRRSSADDKYQLSGNTIGVLPKNSSLYREEFLAVAEVDGAGNEVKIFLAEPITKDEILEVFAEQIIEEKIVRWDEKSGGIDARKVIRFGAILLSEQQFEVESEHALPIILTVIRSKGIEILPWEKESNSLRTRSEWLRKKKYIESEWVNLSSEYLLAALEKWLAPFLQGVRRWEHVQKLNMKLILHSMFSYQQLQRLERLAPSHINVPSGSRIALDYSNGEQPILAVRLQEMFGESTTPAIANGKATLQVHLLSPANRVLAVTQDLSSFWKSSYSEVRKQMRGEYPKHIWPEDPLQAAPTRKTIKNRR